VTKPSDEQETRPIIRSSRAYRTPRLCVYGEMRNLTAGGTTDANEQADVSQGKGKGLRRP
jgi:hypothetical protein